jgi:hypothetical protein
MCNDYGNYVDYDDYLAAFSQIRIPVTWPNAIPNLQSSTLRQCVLRLPCAIVDLEALTMTRFMFLMLERHHVVAPNPARPLAASVPAL